MAFEAQESNHLMRKSKEKGAVGSKSVPDALVGGLDRQSAPSRVQLRRGTSVAKASGFTVIVIVAQHKENKKANQKQSISIKTQQK